MIANYITDEYRLFMNLNRHDFKFKKEYNNYFTRLRDEDKERWREEKRASSVISELRDENEGIRAETMKKIMEEEDKLEAHVMFQEMLANDPVLNKALSTLKSSFNKSTIKYEMMGVDSYTILPSTHYTKRNSVDIGNIIKDNTLSLEYLRLFDKRTTMLSTSTPPQYNAMIDPYVKRDETGLIQAIIDEDKLRHSLEKTKVMLDKHQENIDSVWDFRENHSNLSSDEHFQLMGFRLRESFEQKHDEAGYYESSLHPYGFIGDYKIAMFEQTKEFSTLEKFKTALERNQRMNLEGEGIASFTLGHPTTIMNEQMEVNTEEIADSEKHIGESILHYDRVKEREMASESYNEIEYQKKRKFNDYYSQS